MSAPLANSTTECPTEYLREVRRLRATYARKPAELQSRLRSLGQQRDQTRAGLTPPTVSTPPATRVDVRRVPMNRMAVLMPSARRPTSTPPTVTPLTVTPKYPATTPSARTTPATPAKPTTPGLLAVPADIAETFVKEIHAAIESGILRYSARRDLLARAQQLAIGRFDANLLIASVLHAVNPTHAAAPKSPTIPLWLWIIAAQATLVAVAYLTL